MATLREIRKKLHSVANIQKITQAMEMVAASRLRKAQSRAEKSRPYFSRLKEILDHLITSGEEFNHPLIQPREVKKIGFVIIAGDRGLCGAYNHAVFSEAEKKLRNYKPEQVELILVGRKAMESLSGKKWKVGTTLSDWGGKITYPQIENFTQQLIAQYLSGNFDEIWLIYTHFISAAAREVKVEKLLNIETVKKDNSSASTLFEPSVEEILAELLPHYCISKIQSALHEAYASELAARIFSMRAATKNAEEMIQNLTLTRNKIRQASITKELIEISSSVESLK